jgi:citrate lyase beta subunit
LGGLGAFRSTAIVNIPANIAKSMRNTITLELTSSCIDLETSVSP